jgi:acetyl-CoA carboxylase biotin carboxyl carrier protein
MAENRKSNAREGQPDVVRFVHEQVDPLSKLFAESPLAQLTVKTKQGSVTLERAAEILLPATELRHADNEKTVGESARHSPRHAPLVPAANGEIGRTYITVNSEVVGIFYDAATPPSPGERLQSGQVLGYIEALRLRNEVHCPADATLVAQVVVNGQPVDFGEALFVVDTTESLTLAEQPQEVESQAVAVVAEPPVEPPRI